MSVVVKIRPPRSQCPYVMHAKTPEGIMVGEYQCELPVDHEGMHHGGGLKWGNSAQLEREMDPLHPKRPLIVLPSRSHGT